MTTAHEHATPPDEPAGVAAARGPVTLIRPLAVVGILLSLPSVTCVPMGISRYYPRAWPDNVSGLYQQPVAIGVMVFEIGQALLGVWLLAACAAVLMRGRRARGVMLGYSVAAVLFGLVSAALVYRLLANATRTSGPETTLGIPFLGALLGWGGGLIFGAVMWYLLTRPGAREAIRNPANV